MTEDGELITEGAIIVQYIADLVPDAKLAPKFGTRERRRLQEWLHFIATELHKGLSPFNNPKANDEFKESIRERIRSRVSILAGAVEKQPYLLGNDFSVADAYGYYILRSLKKWDAPVFEKWPALAAYFARLEARPAVRAALVAEGLS